MSGQLEVIFLSPYGYTPTLGVSIFYVVVFSSLVLLHTAQAIYFKVWWLLPTVCLGAVGEVIGWSGRLWSSLDVFNGNPFLMQITTTIIAPSFMTAANFIMLGIIIRRLGPQYSRLSPTLYSRVFIMADVIGLILQGTGGGIASVGSANNDVSTANQGANIMLSGIIFQMVFIALYVGLAVEFVLRVRLDSPVQSFRVGRSSQGTASEEAERMRFQSAGFGFAQGSKLSLMVMGLGISTAFIFIRSVYRTVELSGGWSGPVITTEWFFDVFDALPIAASLLTLSFLHPGWLLFRDDVPLLKNAAGSQESQYSLGDMPKNGRQRSE